MSRQIATTLGTALLVTLLFSAPVAAARVHFLYQDTQLAPFQRAITYVVNGKRTPTGCTYTYPDFVIPADVDRWQVRDVGIDPEQCVKLVEEGVPTIETALEGDSAASLPIGDSDSGAAMVGTASIFVASGYARAWFEDLPGWDVTSDKTYISWTYNGSCATAGSASGEWSWIAGTGWQLVSGSNGGTANLTCSRYFADTWSTMKNSAFCPWTTIWTYYYHVRIYGWYNGTVTGSRSDSTTGGLCLPLWEHFEVKKTG
jgi:hypothetical protein